MNNQKSSHSFLAVASMVALAGIAFIFSVLFTTGNKPPRTETYAAEKTLTAPVMAQDPRDTTKIPKTVDDTIFMNTLKELSTKKSTTQTTSTQLNMAAAIGTSVSTPDLDVIYIARTPRYYRYCLQYPNNVPQLCPGTENQKHWPDIGEIVTYEAHITAKGYPISGTIGYEWDVDGVLATNGQMDGASLSVNQDFFISTYNTTWKANDEKIQFKAWIITPPITEQTLNNNQLTIGSHDLTISYWVETGQYNAFNALLNSVGSYSFEDWMQLHIATLNQRLKQAVYPNVPNGITDQVHIDKFVVADEMDGPNTPRGTDPDLYLIDGRWQSTDNDQTNARGQNGFYQQYANQYVSTIDWGLIHELTHQLGAIDLYMMNIPEAPPNNGLQMNDVNGALVTRSRFPYNGLNFPNYDLMGGGDISPYTDHTMYSFHTAAGLQSNAGFRRGFYGEYLFDTPDNTSVQILDINGQPVSNAQVDMFQRDPHTEIFDNIPEQSGITDANGILALTNRPAPSVTTITGHTQKSNPFGQIYVAGNGDMMATRVIKDGQDGYAFFLLHDLNVAYWQGQKQNAIIPLKTNFVGIAPSSTPIPSATSVPTPTFTPLPTATFTPTPTFTLTPTPTIKPSSTPIVTPTKTPTPSKTPTPTRTPTPTPDLVVPVVSITFPLNNATVLHGKKTIIQATASDASGILKVQFYVNNVLKCTDRSAPYSCGWSVPSPIGALYTITATAFDNKNNTASTSIQVTSN